MGGFGVFVIVMIAYHCRLRIQMKRRIDDVVLRETIENINAKGAIVDITTNAGIKHG